MKAIVEEVTTRKGLREFVEFPYLPYRGYRTWVPVLRSEMTEIATGGVRNKTWYLRQMVLEDSGSSYRYVEWLTQNHAWTEWTYESINKAWLYL